MTKFKESKISKFNEFLQGNDKDANDLAYKMIVNSENLSELEDEDIFLLYISVNFNMQGISKSIESAERALIMEEVIKRKEKMTFEEQSSLISRLYSENYPHVETEEKIKMKFAEKITVDSDLPEML
jgi:hypothetical protein